MDERKEQMSLNEKKVLNFQEACELTGFTTSYLRKLCMLDIIPFSKPNGKVLRFEKVKLEAWLLNKPKTTIYERQTKAAATTTILSRRK